MTLLLIGCMTTPETVTVIRVDCAGSLVMPTANEIDALSPETRRQILENNEIYSDCVNSKNEN